jgi:hypothetical protein
MASQIDDDIDDYEAVEQPDGSWLHNDGDVCWYNEAANYHREDGPAIIPKNAKNTAVGRWWLDNHAYTFDQWCIALNKTDEAKMLLKLQYA